jgi:hypothetical protein
VLAEVLSKTPFAALEDTARGLADALTMTDTVDLAHATHVGTGPCGRCSMHFSSIGTTIIDARTPGVSINAQGGLRINRALNIGECPFCGWRARLLMPMVAMLPRRGPIVVCIPSPSGRPDPGAAQAHQPKIANLIARARQAAGTDGLAGLDTSRVIETWNPQEFFYALHTGTTAPEHHVYSVVRLADGRRFVSDQTKMFFAELTDQDPVHYAPTGLPELPDEAPLARAVAAFNKGDAAAAETELRRVISDDPQNISARFYLALALRAQNKDEAARRLLYALDSKKGEKDK